MKANLERLLEFVFQLCRGYMAPEYAMHGYLTEKADIFSFGVVISEIVSGKRNTIRQSKGEAFYLLDWVTSFVNILHC